MEDASRRFCSPHEHTLAFVRDAFARFGITPGSRIIEIGCGDGELAAAISNAGFDAAAVDADEGCVRRATKRGVRAVCAEWPGDARLATDAPMDAALFTRSLHHVRDLPGALDRAREVLREDGLLIIEDFAFSEAAASEVLWLFSHVDTLCGAGLVSGAIRDRMFGEPGTAAIEAWLTDHDHDLHPWPVMESAVAARFKVVESIQVPYLYRYVHRMLVESGAGPATVAAIVQRLAGHELRREQELGARLIGRRLVARRTRDAE